MSEHTNRKNYEMTCSVISEAMVVTLLLVVNASAIACLETTTVIGFDFDHEQFTDKIFGVGVRNTVSTTAEVLSKTNVEITDVSSISKIKKYLFNFENSFFF